MLRDAAYLVGTALQPSDNHYIVIVYVRQGMYIQEGMNEILV